MTNLIGHRLRQTAELINGLRIRVYAEGRYEHSEDGKSFEYRIQYFLINGLKGHAFRATFEKALADDFSSIDIALDNRSTKEAESLRQALNDDIHAIVQVLDEKRASYQLEIFGNYKSMPGGPDELLPRSEFDELYLEAEESSGQIFEWIKGRIRQKEEYYHFEIEEAESRLPVSFTQAQFILLLRLAEVTHLIDFSEWTDPQIRAWLQKNFLFLDSSTVTDEPEELLALATKQFNERTAEEQQKRYADTDLEKAKEQLEKNGNIPKRVVNALEDMLEYIKQDLPS